MMPIGAKTRLDLSPFTFIRALLAVAADLRVTSEAMRLSATTRKCLPFFILPSRRIFLHNSFKQNLNRWRRMFSPGQLSPSF